jgi:membrane protease YdiL (CAAX protease family)
MPSPSLARKILSFPLTRLVIALLWVGGIAIGVSLALQSLRSHVVTDQSWLWGLVGVVIIVPAVLLAYWSYVRVLERRHLTELEGHDALPQLTRGALLGAGLYGATIAVLAVLGCYRPVGINSALPVLTTLAGACLAGVLEEIVFRGIVYRILEEWLGSWLALILSSSIFGLAHLANPDASLLSGLAIALEAGLLLGAAYALIRTLWFPIGLHIGWNFCEGGIFSHPISGGSAKGLIEGVLHGPDWLTGGSFGVEASVVAILVCLSAAVVMLWRAGRGGCLRRPPWRDIIIAESAQGVEPTTVAISGQGGTRAEGVT